MNRERAILERKYFICGDSEHIACNCRNKRNIKVNKKVEIRKKKKKESCWEKWW